MVSLVTIFQTSYLGEIFVHFDNEQTNISIFVSILEVKLRAIETGVLKYMLKHKVSLSQMWLFKSPLVIPYQILT